MATMYSLLGVFLLLATAHAQFDFCANGRTRRAGNDATVREEIETNYFAVDDEHRPQVADSAHDLVEGNCTGDIGKPVFVDNECVDPNPSGVAMHSHLYAFIDKVITCIKVVDRFEDGTGGYPTIYSGGVGGSYVEVEFVSQEYKGLKFYMEIYAKLETSTTPNTL